MYMKIAGFLASSLTSLFSILYPLARELFFGIENTVQLSDIKYVIEFTKNCD